MRTRTILIIMPAGRWRRPHPRYPRPGPAPDPEDATIRPGGSSWMQDMRSRREGDRAAHGRPGQVRVLWRRRGATTSRCSARCAPASVRRRSLPAR
jgi:hypothetical protein